MPVDKPRRSWVPPFGAFCPISCRRVLDEIQIRNVDTFELPSTAALRCRKFRLLHTLSKRKKNKLWYLCRKFAVPVVIVTSINYHLRYIHYVVVV